MDKKYLVQLTRLLGMLEQMEPAVFIDYHSRSYKPYGETHTRFKERLSDLRKIINEGATS